MVMNKRRFLIYAPEYLGPLTSKTANGLIKFCTEEVVAVIDPSKQGRVAEDVLGYGGEIPIVVDLDAAMEFDPDTLVIGIAPSGGRMPQDWIPSIRDALARGLEVWSGLHDLLADYAELEAWRDKIWDMRRSPANLHIAQGAWRTRKSRVLLTIGSDCNIGKMTAALVLQEQLRELGLESVFVGTGQTGMAISGRGVAVDAIVSDFVNGAIETEIMKVDGQAPLILVEGQGAITHMGYSGVTAGLIHGAMPDFFLIAHQPSRLTDDYDHPLPDLGYLVELHELMVQNFNPGKVMGVNIYSKDLSLEESAAECTRLQKQLNLPVEDLVRQPTMEIARSLIRLMKDDLSR